MKQKSVATWLFFAVAVLSLIGAFLPLARGGSMNVVFLGAAVVFFVIGAAVVRKERGHRA